MKVTRAGLRIFGVIMALGAAWGCSSGNTGTAFKPGTAGATWMSAFGGTPGYEGPGGGTVNNYELVLWALKVAKLNVTGMNLNQIHSTLLPAQSLASAPIYAKGTRNGL